MSLHPVPPFKRIIHGLFWVGLSVEAAQAAPANCPQLENWPTTYEVGQGLQSELRSPVPVTQLAVGDPCLLYTSPSPRDGLLSRMPSSA